MTQTKKLQIYLRNRCRHPDNIYKICISNLTIDGRWTHNKLSTGKSIYYFIMIPFLLALLSL